MLNPAEPIPVAARCRVCFRLSYSPLEIGHACWRIADRHGTPCGGLMEAVSCADAAREAARGEGES